MEQEANMFSSRSFLITFCIGAAALTIGILMALTGAICLKSEIGTPEYIISLRNTGLTVSILSVLWLALAIWKESEKS